MTASPLRPEPWKACSIGRDGGCEGRLRTIGQTVLAVALSGLGLQGANAVTLDSGVAVTDPATLQALERGGLSISLLPVAGHRQGLRHRPRATRNHWSNSPAMVRRASATTTPSRRPAVFPAACCARRTATSFPMRRPAADWPRPASTTASRPARTTNSAPGNSPRPPACAPATRRIPAARTISAPPAMTIYPGQAWRRHLHPALFHLPVPRRRPPQRLGTGCQRVRMVCRRQIERFTGPLKGLERPGTTAEGNRP